MRTQGVILGYWEIIYIYIYAFDNDYPAAPSIRLFLASICMYWYTCRKTAIASQTTKRILYKLCLAGGPLALDSFSFVYIYLYRKMSWEMSDYSLFSIYRCVSCLRALLYTCFTDSQSLFALLVLATAQWEN